jgi:ABC-type amino acid transport substrate-binding protein
MSRIVSLIIGLLLSACANAAEPKGALAQINRSGVIKLGYLTSAPPFSFDRDGAPAGYTVDVCTHVAQDIGHQLGRAPLRIEWVKLTQQDRLAAVREGRVQVECGTTTDPVAPGAGRFQPDDLHRRRQRAGARQQRTAAPQRPGG